MPNPRVVIVDDEMGYIIPLQARLAEEYSRMVEIEIITKKEYFQVFFAVPQSIDLLIITNKFYSLELQRHNIKKTILLIEELEAGIQLYSNTIQLFKYSDIREILNIINSRSMGIFLNNHKENMTQIVLVTSACGGVGKTTVAMGICSALEIAYKKVLYVGAEYLQTFQYWLNDLTPITDSKIYSEIGDNSRNAYLTVKSAIKSEVFCYLPPFKAAILSMGISFSVFEKIISDAKMVGDYDYIVVDTDSIFSEDKVRLLGIADKVLVVTDQTERSYFATEQLIKNISELNTEKYLFICNMYEQNSTIGDKYMDFTINDFVEHYTNSKLQLNNVSQIGGIQRIAYLLQ